MALGPRLDLRQTQSLVMTPQLQQAIKLLALSNLELEAFIGEALEANPLLEMGEGTSEPAEAPTEAPDDAQQGEPTADQLIREGNAEADAPFDLDPEALGHDRETGDGAGIELRAPVETSSGSEGPDIEERASGEETLAEHLEAQVGAVAEDERQEFIARHLIGLLDEAGYLTSSRAG